jgi:DNA-binding NtrC family response regulator
MAFWTSNPRMLQIHAVGHQVVHTDVPILVLGESGIGKEIVARFILTKSRREPLTGIGTLWP